MVSTTTLPLRGGNTIPWLAYGVGTANRDSDVTDIVKTAIKLGFRHFDGAQGYNNEEYLGVAIEESGIPRSEFFVTTKVSKLDKDGKKTVRDVLNDSLSKLRTSYVDLFLIHTPLLREGHIGTIWQELVQLKREGLTRDIGVSNFGISHLEQIVATGLELPVVNQLEFQPFIYNQSKPLLEFHAKHGILTASYGGLSPLVPKRATTDDAPKEAIEELTILLDKFAEKRSKEGTAVTQNQILLKWLQQQNIIAVTTTSKESRLIEYLETESLPNLSPTELEEFEESIEGVHHRFFKYFDYLDREDGLSA